MIGGAGAQGHLMCSFVSSVTRNLVTALPDYADTTRHNGPAAMESRFDTP